MAKNYVRLDFSPVSARIVLTEPLQKLWNDIQFYEESRQYDQYDKAWEDFMNLAHQDIMDQIESDLYVEGAREYRGA